MARWYGVIGFAKSVETSPSVWTDEITERAYRGEVMRNTRKLQSANQVNDDINIANEFSIVADAFAKQNFHSMQYLVYMGTKWKITDVQVEFPRLKLTVGGVYNG